MRQVLLRCCICCSGVLFDTGVVEVLHLRRCCRGVAGVVDVLHVFWVLFNAGVVGCCRCCSGVFGTSRGSTCSKWTDPVSTSSARVTCCPPPSSRTVRRTPTSAFPSSTLTS